MQPIPPNVTPLRPSAAIAEREVYYVKPTLDELMKLCEEFDLIADVQTVGDGYLIQCKDESFQVSATEASFLVKGLLIGHFAFHTRDDLSLANWSH